MQRKFSIRLGTFITLLADGLTLQLVLFVGLMIRSLWGDIDLGLYTLMGALLCFGPIFNLILGSCEAPVPPPHKEVKKLFLGVSLVYLIILLFIFMMQISVSYSRIIIVFSWFASVIAVPVVRGILRRRLCRKPWWGTPVVFLQSREVVANVWNELEKHPERGLRPEECLDLSFDDDSWKFSIEQAQEKYCRPMFVWCRKDSNHFEQSAQFEEVSLLCKNILVVCANVKRIKKFWLSPRVLGRTTAFLVRQNLTDLRRLRLKRCMDVVLASLGIIALIPLFLYLIAWIRLGSSGPAFYRQKRIGQGGKHILVWKFRTMVQNADVVLQEYLEKNEDLRSEWKKNQKLRHDPRITKAGRFLRKTSLDELPQLFNVLWGTMTLVGPRPIVDSEIERYGDVYLEYQEVKPGITGLWQISGRNNTTYEERIWYDRYYVTNWSVWMDLWILMRTIPVALRGEGAY